MDRARAGQRVVVVGGRYVGMEAAVKQAEAGRHVSIIDAGEIARDANPRINGVYRDRLVELGVCMYPNTPLLGFTGTGVDAARIGSLLHLPCDTVVLAIGTVVCTGFGAGSCCGPQRGRMPTYRRLPENRRCPLCPS